MKEMTLRELIEATGVSRRAIQGYEKEGLMQASGKNQYGHLLYDEAIKERVSLIRLYQEFGFTLKEITCLLDAPDHMVKKALETQLVILMQKRDRMDVLIIEINELINNL
jgi:DNA-binding transcriptional MerR regulator